MKKLMLILISAMCFGLIGCASYYNVINDNINDLEYPRTFKTVYFYYTGFYYNYEIGIRHIKYSKNNLSQCCIILKFMGLSWKFLDGIKIKTDNNLYTVECKNPERFVSGGSSSARVRENLVMEITKEMFNDIANTKELRIQPFGKYIEEPIIIPSDRIEWIKRFYDEVK